jgi:hypothetical protein
MDLNKTQQEKTAMSELEEYAAALQNMGRLLERVNANWNLQNPDVMTPAWLLNLAAASVELAKTIDIFTLNVVSRVAGQVAEAIDRGLADTTSSDDRASVRELIVGSGPETSPTSLYWQLMALVKASQHHVTVQQVLHQG